MKTASPPQFPSPIGRNVRGERLLLFYFFSLITLSFCACTTRLKDNNAPHEPQSLTFGLMSSMDGLPFTIADKLGIYDSLGLKVNFIKYYSPIDRDAAFQTGQIDGAITDYSSAILQQSKGTRLRLIMQTDGYCQLIAGKESKIKNPEQLKEKNIAISYATVIEYATDKILGQANIKAGETNKPEINNIPLRLAMLENGQIDATFLPDPYACMATSNGAHLITSTRQMKITFTGTAFNEKALKEKAEEIKLLIAGYNLGVEYIRKHTVNEWMQLLTEETGLTEAEIKNLMLPVYRLAARPDSCDIAQAIHWLQKKKAIPLNYTGVNLIDTTFAPKQPHLP